MHKPTAIRLSRRNWFAAVAGGLACASFLPPWASAAAPIEDIRLGVLQFGTVQWVTDVILRNHLDEVEGVRVKANMLADTAAGRIALLAGADDVIVSDWMFAAAQRAAGTRLCFSPFSTSVGGIMLRPGLSLTGFADLQGRKLGVAGGPVDKSWLIVQAACHATTGLDLTSAARVVYGAPPLLNAKLQQGELDAVLTFWNFAAKLEAAGCREMISVADCARALALPPELSLVGFVFRQDWAEKHRSAIDGFLKAVAVAQKKLADSGGEWLRIRPLMEAPNDAVFSSLKRRFIDGIPAAPPSEQQKIAEQVFAVLLKTGGTRATAGLTSLPAGTFWLGPDAAG